LAAINVGADGYAAMHIETRRLGKLDAINVA
jgi:hypothetical protein